MASGHLAEELIVGAWSEGWWTGAVGLAVGADEVELFHGVAADGPAVFVDELVVVGAQEDDGGPVGVGVGGDESGAHFVGGVGESLVVGGGNRARSERFGDPGQLAGVPR